MYTVYPMVNHDISHIFISARFRGRTGLGGHAADDAGAVTGADAAGGGLAMEIYMKSKGRKIYRNSCWTPFLDSVSKSGEWFQSFNYSDFSLGMMITSDELSVVWTELFGANSYSKWGAKELPKVSFPNDVDRCVSLCFPLYKYIIIIIIVIIIVIIIIVIIIMIIKYIYIYTDLFLW